MRKLVTAVLIALGMASSAFCVPFAAHADSPQVGQPCDYASQVILRGNTLTELTHGPALLCGPEVHRWVLWHGEGLSTSESEEIGAPCHVPSGYLAMGITPPDFPVQGMYLVTCNEGIWGAYRA